MKFIGNLFSRQNGGIKTKVVPNMKKNDFRLYFKFSFEKKNQPMKFDVSYFSKPYPPSEAVLKYFYEHNG